MTTIQLSLDPETSAKLAYLAELRGERKANVALNLLKKEVVQEYEETANIKTTLPTPLPPSPARRVTRGQRVLYTGSGPRLQSGRTYSSFAEVLRIIRADLVRLLYNAKTHTGDKAENILKRHEPGVYKDLRRI